MEIAMVTVILMTVIFCNFSVLQISFLCFYLERHVKLHYLNGNPEILPIFRTDLIEAFDTAYLISLIINEEFDSNVVCHKNQIKPEQNCCFIIQKSSLNHQKDVFSDGIGRWERSRIKHLKYEESVVNSIEKVLDENKEEYNKIWNIKRCIHYHHESRDFHRAIIFIEQIYFIFVQYYFEDDEHPVNTFKQHGISCSSKKSYKRREESVKLSVCNSSLEPKESVAKIFKEAGGYLYLRSCSDFPRDRAQVTNLKYSKNIN